MLAMVEKKWILTPGCHEHLNSDNAIRVRLPCCQLELEMAVKGGLKWQIEDSIILKRE